MSAPRKARGTDSGLPESPMQRLKAVWRVLSDEERDYWRKQFVSSRKQADIREEIQAKYEILLPADCQLNVFRDWVYAQNWRDTRGARARENEARIRAEHPDWTLEQVRDEVLKQSFLETLATGDFKLGLKTVAQDVNVRRVSLDEAKVLEAKKAEQAKALEFCLEEAREFPCVQKLFRRAFAALKASKNGGGHQSAVTKAAGRK